jgi:APA family basic amino acid/polyamine antiporter
VTILRFIVWLAIGLLIYFLYSRRHSKLEGEYEEDVRHEFPLEA